MLIAKNLLRLTPPKVVYRSSYPSVRIIDDSANSKKKKKKTNTDFRIVYTRTSLGNEESTGDSYTLILQNHGTKKNPLDHRFQMDSHIWCHCSCPYFTYYLEVVLTLHKSSSFYNTNKALPKITNPRLRPYFCKHLYATYLHLIKMDKGAKGRALFKDINA